MTSDEYKAEKKLRQHHLDRVKDDAKRVRRLRWYALTDEQLTFLAALHKASGSHAKGGRTPTEVFAAALNAMARHVNGLFQPELEEPKLPNPPRDIITNEILFMPESQTERALMQQRFPDWY